ncbi:MAG TPA: acetyl-coenzyme A synthetase N-terminal domain-containing protein, partial [Gaiellaceae bacterium]
MSVLWEPSAEQVESSRLTRYLRARGFESYEELWRWSVTDLDGFWGSLWEEFEVQASRPYERVLGRREMPGAEWFPGAELSYV